MRRSFIVSFEVPQNATIQDCVDYIRDSVTTWCGSLRPEGAYDESDPGDTMRYLDTNSIRVKKVVP